MANTSQTGFKPAFKLGGGPVPVMRFPVHASASATAIFVGDVLRNDATYGSVYPAAADAGVTVVGVCVALYDSKGVPIGSPGSSVTTKYLPGSTAGYADVALALPDCVFIAQGQSSNFSGATLIFSSADHRTTAGDTTTGRSDHELYGNALNTEAQCQVLGLVNSPDNAWGADAKMYIRFLESMWGQVNPSVGV